MRRIWLPLLFCLLLIVLAACSTETEPEEDSGAAEPAATEAVSEPEEMEAEEEAEPEAEEEAEAPSDQVTIGMMKIVSHPALESIQQGFLDTLAAAGYVEGENLTIIDGNAEGDIATLSTIAQQFIDEEVDLIAATSTPALQAAYNATQDMVDPIPIVFNAVTSPYAAGVANAPDDHPAWVIGTAIFPPIESTFDVIQELLPDVEVIGLLYSPAEANSVAQFEVISEVAEERGITLEVATISNSSEVKTAAEALVGRGIDIFYYSQDSTVATGLEGLIQTANDNDIPIFTNDVPGAERGAAVAVGLDFTDDGIISGQFAVGILDGDLDIPSAEIVAITATEHRVNLDAAEAQGLTVSQEILDTASIVYGGE